jgi:hypothetical protein
MITHRLDGARLKVVRAQQHLKSLNEELRRYIDAKPYEITTKRERNNISVEGIITTEPPPLLACIVGDFVTNLRASLDYVTWQLANRFAPVVLNDRQQRQVAFPIVSEKTNFATANATAFLRDTCAVSTDALDIIESVQPYNTGYKPIGDLDLLVRTDKHRSLLLCALFMENMGTVSVYHGHELIFTGCGIKLETSAPRFAGFGAINVKVDTEPTILVALKDVPAPFTFIGILDDVIKCIANIIPRFDRFF